MICNGRFLKIKVVYYKERSYTKKMIMMKFSVGTFNTRNLANPEKMSSNCQWKMKVEGIDKAVGVER